MATTEAIRLAIKAEESNNICIPSPINPKLFVITPYTISTKVKEILRRRKKKTLRVDLLLRIVFTKFLKIENNL